MRGVSDSAGARSAVGPNELLKSVGRRTVPCLRLLVGLAASAEGLVVVVGVVVGVVVVFIIEVVAVVAVDGVGAAGSIGKVNCIRWMMCSGICALASRERSFSAARWRMSSVELLRWKAGAGSSSILLG